MALCVVTINNQAPALEHKSGEAAVIARALSLAAQAIQQAQGTVTSGNIVDNQGAGPVVIGSWATTPQAALP